MSVSASTHPTMLDYQTRVNGKGEIADIIEIIRQENQLLDYIPWIKCNDGSAHETSVRTGLPTPTWRKLYGGVQPTKSVVRKVKDTTGIMHAYAEVDCDLVQKNGNSAAFRMTENSGHLDGMNEEFMSTFFYGNEGTEPEAFTGMSPRYNDSRVANAENARNTIHANDGTSEVTNTSMWVMSFGPRALHGIYPDGFEMGLKHDDKGQVTIEDVDGSNGGRMEAFRSHYRWACGMSLRNWQTCARTQFRYESLTKDASANSVDLFDQVSKMLARTKRGGGDTKKVIVVNEGTLEFLRLQAKHAVTSSTLSRSELAGREVDVLDGVPVLMCDALLYTEGEILH